MNDIVFFNLSRHVAEYRAFIARVGHMYRREERFIMNGEHWAKLIKTAQQPREYKRGERRIKLDR